MAVTRNRTAVAAAIAHLTCAVAVQVLLNFAYLQPARFSRRSLAFVATVPFLQAENVAAALLLAATVWLTRSRWTALIGVGLMNLLLVADFANYKILGDRIRISSFETTSQLNAGLMLTSVAREVDPWLIAVCLIALAGCVFVWRAPVAEPGRGWFPVAAILLLSGLPAVWRGDYASLEQHTLFTPVRESLIARLPSSASAEPDSATIAALLNREALRDPAIPNLVRALPPRPNIVLIVIESVGSIPMLARDNRPASDFTPNIARLARSGIVFPNLYTTFPGSTRSMFALNAGGRTMTSSGVFELNYGYQGPLLASELNRRGYETALFSSERLDGENSDVFLSRAGFGTYYDFSQDRERQTPEFTLHSWGAREEVIIDLASDWIRRQPRSKPFFLEYYTNATHHPYTVPPGYSGPVPNPGANKLADYLNALHYTDSAVGRLVEFLKREGLADETIIAITGDHGEAFGARHWNVMSHKGSLYEENVREFLVLSSPRWAGTAAVSSRVAGMGGIMPTLLRIAGQSDAMPNVPARSLLDEPWQPEPVYFYKFSWPPKWGLRDGRWKFIGPIAGSARPELYDLESDPLERRNLAWRHPERIRAYTALCRRWYLAEDREFRARLGNAKQTGAAELTSAELGGTGIQSVSVGRFEGAAFLAQSDFPTQQAPTAFSRWHIAEQDRTARYTWRSPSGREFRQEQSVEAAWSTVVMPCPVPAPLEPGVWHLRLDAVGGSRAVEFTVR